MSQKELVWLITGTSSGFGRELTLNALRRGDKVIATSRGSSVQELKDLEKAGADILELDVTSPLETLHEVVKQAHATYGRLDVLVNNAGYLLVGAIEESTPEETLHVFNTNMFGALNVARAVLPYMRAQRSGTIVWFGSLGAWRPTPNSGLYNASKTAIRAISETLNVEIAPLGLRSIVFEPGFFRTSFLKPGHRTPQVERISDYASMTRTSNERINNSNGTQPGDPHKATELIIDIVKGNGALNEKVVPSTFQLGTDCVSAVKLACEKTMRNVQEWEDVFESTDF